jgi:hypothetical protein
MLDAMQTAGIAAFDADIDASLGDTPLDPTHARRAIWRAALDAAPEAPSAEPCPYVRGSAEGTHWCALAEQPTDHRAVMRQAIEALRDAHAYSVMHEEFRDGVLDVIEALRAALGEKE